VQPVSTISWCCWMVEGPRISSTVRALSVNGLFTWLASLFVSGIVLGSPRPHSALGVLSWVPGVPDFSLRLRFFSWLVTC